jgi:hypothetical protein
MKQSVIMLRQVQLKVKPNPKHSTSSDAIKGVVSFQTFQDELECIKRGRDSVENQSQLARLVSFPDSQQLFLLFFKKKSPKQMMFINILSILAALSATAVVADAPDTDYRLSETRYFRSHESGDIFYNMYDCLAPVDWPSYALAGAPFHASVYNDEMFSQFYGCVGNYYPKPSKDLVLMLTKEGDYNIISPAEIEVYTTDNVKVLITEDDMDASYEHVGFPLSKMLDGKPETFFHTNYDIEPFNTRHFIRINLSSVNDPAKIGRIYIKNREEYSDRMVGVQVALLQKGLTYASKTIAEDRPEYDVIPKNNLVPGQASFFS